MSLLCINCHPNKTIQTLRLGAALFYKQLNNEPIFLEDELERYLIPLRTGIMLQTKLDDYRFIKHDK